MTFSQTNLQFSLIQCDLSHEIEIRTIQTSGRGYRRRRVDSNGKIFSTSLPKVHPTSKSVDGLLMHKAY